MMAGCVRHGAKKYGTNLSRMYHIHIGYSTVKFGSSHTSVSEKNNLVFYVHFSGLTLQMEA
jgi:hypothetical protein